MKADLHVHSSFSEDGKEDVESILRECAERGLGAVAITDHNSLEGSQEAVKKNSYGLIIVPGEEITTARGGHILAYNIREPIPKGLPVEETIAMIHAQGGLAVLAHPFRIWSGLGGNVARSAPFDAIEVQNGRSLSGSNRRALAIARHRGLGLVGGSDSHSIITLGKCYTIIDDGCRTASDLVEAIRSGRSRIGGEGRTVLESIRYGLGSIARWMRRGFRRL